MSIIKFQACQALADYLSSFLPGVPVQVGMADYDTPASYPSVVVKPLKYNFRHFQDEEANDTIDSKLLINVGEFEGQVQILVNSTKESERDNISDTIYQAFFQQELASGVVLLSLPTISIGGVDWLSPSNVAFMLTDETWQDERVFDSIRSCNITVDSQLPALVSRNSYTIDQLILSLNNDLSSNEVIDTITLS